MRFSAREKAALAWAEQMTRPQRAPSRESLVSLQQYFDDDAIIELSALVAFQNMSSKFNAALGVVPQGFCAIAPQPETITVNSDNSSSDSAGDRR